MPLEDYNDVKWTSEREKVEQRQHRDRKEIETEAGMRREEKEEWIECLGPENSKGQVGKQSAKALARLVIFCIAVALSFILLYPFHF